MKNLMAMILAGGEGPALSVLTAQRSEAAMPFAGKYRVIDFALSNCVNSGIFNVAVLTQYQPRSLNEHIGLGRPWDLDRTTGGVRLLQPYVSSKGGHAGAWQEGTADAVRFNLDLTRAVDEVLILPGDHIYKMDYNPMLKFHRESGADVTIATRPVPYHQAHRFGMVGTDQSGRVIEYAEKPKRTYNTTASMGIYIFKAALLRDWLRDGGQKDTNLHPAGACAAQQRLRLPVRGLLGGRRDDPGLLRGEHGLAGGDARARPLRRELGDPHQERGTRRGVPRREREGGGQPAL
jgi:glucose-1-phosphate adenylyltransferase